jgi:hypothetical protein
MRIAFQRRRTAILSIAIVSALLVGAPSAFAAPHANGLVPFHATFQQTIVDFSCEDAACDMAQIVLSGHGTATHLGKATELINATIDSTNATPAHPCSVLNDTRILTAANGDQLFISGTGTACTDPNNPDLETATFTWTVTGGTGRFAGATGSGTETLGNTAGSISVVYEGAISSPGSNK